jgi:glutamyl-Q tRNA(Asp) synthetase
VTRLPEHWRTRFAPAPTGLLHLGHVVNAVYVWSIAQAFGGSVLLRIEDHDLQRCKPEFEQRIHEDLGWLGLRANADDRQMPAMYRQSDHDDVYADACARLSAEGRVYGCRCSRQQLTQPDETNERRYPGTCRTANVAPSETPALRFQLDEGAVTFVDLRHGPQSQTPLEQCGDVMIRDRVGQWTYQFAVAVDDARHEIDVVIRGDDLLPSTGRQLALRSALGRPSPPLFLHHPLMLRPDGRKLSKSLGDSGVSELRQAGLPSSALLGRAAWLGGLQPHATPIDATELARLWE